VRKIIFSVLVFFAAAFSYAAKGATEVGGAMAYCTIENLQSAYGVDRIAGWCRLNPDTADRAIIDADAEIDGYLLSGGYQVPLSPPPQTVQKYSIDISCANLVLSVGVLDSDPGGKAVMEQAKIARHYLEKVA
jgi:phage gp36-like protein